MDSCRAYYLLYVAADRCYCERQDEQDGKSQLQILYNFAMKKNIRNSKQILSVGKKNIDNGFKILIIKTKNTEGAFFVQHK